MAAGTAGTHGCSRGAALHRTASPLLASSACLSAQRTAAAQWGCEQCLRGFQPQQLRQVNRRRLSAFRAHSAAADLLTALQHPPLRDAAATVVTGAGAFAWVKLFNWFASKQVFDQVCRGLDCFRCSQCVVCDDQQQIHGSLIVPQPGDCCCAY